MVRKLKHHEQKLLRKVDFTTYPTQDATHRAAAVTRRYHLPSPTTYAKYNALCGSLRQLAHRLSLLEPTSPFRIRHETLLLEKLHAMGLLKRSREQGAGLSSVEKDVTVSAFCRRRLAVVMVRVGMVQGTVGDAVRFVEQGHVRVGTEVVDDPAYLVTRGLEDFVTWVDGSRMRRVGREYRGEVDDFDLL